MTQRCLSAARSLAPRRNNRQRKKSPFLSAYWHSSVCWFSPPLRIASGGRQCPLMAHWPATHWLRWGFSLICSCSRKTATEDPPLRRLISTGPYAFVRHPMYVGVLIMITGIPLALDALWGLAIIAAAAPALAWRINDEERLLRKQLPGYVEYAQNVRYRLVPYLW